MYTMVYSYDQRTKNRMDKYAMHFQVSSYLMI